MRGRSSASIPKSREAIVGGRGARGRLPCHRAGRRTRPRDDSRARQAGHNFYTWRVPRRCETCGFTGGRLVMLTAARPTSARRPRTKPRCCWSSCRNDGSAGGPSSTSTRPNPGPWASPGPRCRSGAADGGEPTASPITRNTNGGRSRWAPARVRQRRQPAYDLLIYMPPHRAPAVVREAGLRAEAGGSRSTAAPSRQLARRLRHRRRVRHSRSGMGKPLPKAGVFAHREAEVVAANIAGAVTGQGKRWRPSTAKGSASSRRATAGRASARATSTPSRCRRSASRRPAGVAHGEGAVREELAAGLVLTTAVIVQPPSTLRRFSYSSWSISPLANRSSRISRGVRSGLPTPKFPPPSHRTTKHDDGHQQREPRNHEQWSQKHAAPPPAHPPTICIICHGHHQVPDPGVLCPSRSRQE